MSGGYAPVLLTGGVRPIGSQCESGAVIAPERHDPLTPSERRFVAERDGFHLCTVSSSGWPYVQFVLGWPGFVQVPDDHHLVWADVRGNRQYVGAGNIAGEDRVSLLFMDSARQKRLSVLGRARTVDARERPTAAAALAGSAPGGRGVVERIFTVAVIAHDFTYR